MEKAEKDVKGVRVKVEELEFLVKSSLDHSDHQLQEDSVIVNNMDPANDYDDNMKSGRGEDSIEKKTSNSKRIKVIERNMNQIKAQGFLPDVKFNQSIDKSLDNKVSKKLSNTDLMPQDYLTSNFKAMNPGNTSRLAKHTKQQIQDKTLNLLKQTTYHNYSQIIDNHIDIKSSLLFKKEDARKPENYGYNDVSISSLSKKNTGQHNVSKINWENAKLKETNKLLAF